MQPLLSDLCSICHKTTPKYRCPACSTRTCSLECVQKHKSWGCSGKRDPTAYVKKNQLVTASGVDHDYNFLSGIERSRDRADEHLQGRSIQDAEGRSARLNQPAFRNRLHLAQVTIEYAPLGMTRQKLNKTRLTQSKRINWTVEWLHADYTASIGSIFDDEQIQQAYRPLFSRKTGVPRRKRKRDDGPAIPGQPDTVQNKSMSSTDVPAASKGPEEGSTLKRDHEVATSQEPLITQANDDSRLATSAAPVNAIAGSQPVHEDNEAAVEDGSDSGVKAENDVHEHSPMREVVISEISKLHFYLVRPRTTGSEQVLIPLSPTDTFMTCLRNRTILEFPTVQVLNAGPDALPTGFVTEDEYLARYRRQAHDMEQLIKEEGEVAEDDQLAHMQSNTIGDDNRHTQAVPNSSTLLATLERDMLQHK